MDQSRIVGVVRFPGTNCDQDVASWCEALGYRWKFLWYQDLFDVGEVEAIVIPGGFSYGDYVRTGALAAKAPVMRSVKEAADFGKTVLGICNGFQILCEAKLLPGVLVKNDSLQFIDDWVTLKLQNESKSFNKLNLSKTSLRLPIAHGEGKFFCEESELKRILDSGQIWLTYQGSNPNGSLHDIAGVFNQKKNVAGLMPHPERAFQIWQGGIDGGLFL